MDSVAQALAADHGLYRQLICLGSLICLAKRTNLVLIRSAAVELGGQPPRRTPPSYDTGVIGQAFKFDGVNDYITVSGDAALQPATISVAMWFKATSSSADQLLMDSSHGTGNAGWAVQLFGTSRVASQENRVDFAYGNGAGFPHVQSTAIVADDAWHHVLATLDGSDMRIYVDGALDNTVSYTGTPVASTNNGGDIRLGRHYSLNRQLNGLLDDVRIYDNAVTSVPEPSSLLLAGLAGLLFGSRRRRV